jgi:ATP-dependent RNA/DNA helicase IGHMBP2
VLAGDHLQLPPTIMSPKAAAGGLSVTLMERIIDKYGDTVVRMLDTQYRMNEQIMAWSSEHLYEGKLKAHASVASHCLSDLPGVKKTDDTSVPVIFIDTAGCNMEELVEDDEISKSNPEEVAIVSGLVDNLLSLGVSISSIGIITPYNLQVELLQRELTSHLPALEIKSVDGFQVFVPFLFID